MTARSGQGAAEPMLAVEGLRKPSTASASGILASVDQRGRNSFRWSASRLRQDHLLLLRPGCSGRMRASCASPASRARCTPKASPSFRDYSRSLLPWKKSRQCSVRHAPLDGMTPLQKTEHAAGLLEAVASKFADRYPWQLSGGMQQRVAIARGLASQSRLLLLDEPLASVDAQTRADLQDLLLGIAERYRQTCVLVTHDVEEAIYMGDRIVVLSSRPTRVVREIEVPLPRPRDQIETRAQATFLAIRHDVLSLIRATARGRPRCGSMIWLRRLLALAVVLAIWQLAVWLQLAPERYLPSPLTTAEAMARIVASPDDMKAVALTLLRALTGFTLTVPLGIALGILGALVPVFQRMLRPWTELLQPLPPAAIIPISVFAIGFGLKLYLFIIVFAALCLFSHGRCVLGHQ